MSGFAWLHELVTRMQSEHVMLQETDAQILAPAHTLALDMEDWGNAARIAAAFGCRWAGVWGDAVAEHIVLRACLAFQGDYLIMRTDVPLSQPVLPSHTPYYPGADRLERHLQDMFGIAFSAHGKVIAQGIPIGRPGLVAGPAARVRVIGKRDTEHILQMSFQAIGAWIIGCV